MKWAGHVAHMGEMINSYNIFVGKPVWKLPHERPRRIWDDTIKRDLMEL
jgi:hypothetical protein